MNDDEARVRARLHDYADGIEPARDVPAAGRARYRRLVRRRRATAVLGGAIAVIAVVGIGVGVARRPDHTFKLQTGGHPSTTTPKITSSTVTAATTTGPAAGAIVTNERLYDTTWISDHIGWALVAADVVHTTDGGATWRSVSQLPDVSVPPNEVGSRSCVADACVNHIRFADAKHGYLFGRAFLTTDDGGDTWTREPSDAVVALEVLHGRAFRVVSAHDCIAPGCTYLVETAAVGSNSWQRLHTPSVVGDGVQLLYEGSSVYIAVYGNSAGGGDAHIQLLRSLNLGKTWQPRPDPCGSQGGVEVDTASLATAPDGLLFALCQPRGVDRPPSVRMSSDAGTSFGSAQALPVASGLAAESIAAGSSTSIVVAVVDGSKQKQEAWVSHSGGAAGSWHLTLSATATDAQISIDFLGFEDAHTGRIAIEPHLWTTYDGGETWNRSAYP